MPAQTDKPEFEETEKEVIVNVGSTAFLPCRVRNIGDRMVSLNLEIRVRLIKAKKMAQACLKVLFVWKARYFKHTVTRLPPKVTQPLIQG